MPPSIAAAAPPIRIASGPYRAEIVPSAGGIVTSLNWLHPDGHRRSLLHRPADAVAGTDRPNRFGLWAMLPFANRAFGGIVDDGTTRFTVASEDAIGPMHGFGWQSAWAVEEARDDRVTLSHTRTSGRDPYRYRAEQSLVLGPGGLTLDLAVTNRSDRALPYGFGLHPWFDCAADTALTLRASGALTLGESYRATGTTELPGFGPFAQGRRFRSPRATAWSFLGWDGRATVATPSRDLAITLGASDTLHCPVVWAPADADFLCVEPQSHAIGAPSEAIARAASPLARLAPGETLTGRIRIAAAPYSQSSSGGSA